MQFSDKDEHVYFWFPLLAGLSELTFDPRSDVRRSALEVNVPTFKVWMHSMVFESASESLGSPWLYTTAIPETMLGFPENACWLKCYIQCYVARSRNYGLKDKAYRCSIAFRTLNMQCSGVLDA